MKTVFPSFDLISLLKISKRAETAPRRERRVPTSLPFVFQERVLYIKRMEPPLHSGFVGRSPATLENRVPINLLNQNSLTEKLTHKR